MDNAIQTADKCFRQMTQSEEEADTLFRMRLAEWDRVNEIQFGKEQTTLQIARNLLSEGSTPEFTQKITGLDLETIKTL